MAESKHSFPMLPVGHWWALREKFKQSIPGVVTDSYLAAALNLQPKSARANVLPYLRSIGLIDDEGKTQDLAKAWRDDEQYAEVCKKIREQTYPEDLFAAVPNPLDDRDAVQRWFANHTGKGESAVRRMIQFYLALAEADISKKPEPKSAKSNNQKTATKPKETVSKKPVIKEKPVEILTKIEHSEKPEPTTPTGLPKVSINLEIHISADSTPDQIDKIFESMAKHIYNK
ncbi:DUF5343 domain-containing protein [bacterium]|nr:DUF5343 domain-containing protein [bacterium]